jgi:flagellar biosynthetic protein FlhB
MTVLAPVFIVLVIMGVAASALQNTPRFVLERIRPKASKLSLREGFKRLFGRQGAVEFAKATAKLAIIVVVAFLILRAERATVVSVLHSEPLMVPGAILDVSVRLLTGIVAASTLLAAADIVWSRYHWRRQLMMTRQEVKDEHKQSDGDPVIKSRLRSLARDRSRKRMMAAVPNATLIIANPTHYAIALRFVREEGGAPLVLARGKNLLALKIREIARAHEIPVVEDKPLARSMYDAVEVGQMIPVEFYQAVAELIFHISTKPGLHAYRPVQS